jgi:hypothetical protein
MPLRRPLMLFTVLGVGIIGVIACACSTVSVWILGARWRNATNATFARIDGSLVTIQERVEQTRLRVKAM